MATIGPKILATRRRRRLTQQQLAGRARVSRTAISNIENAQRDPTLEQLRRIGRVLKVAAWRDL